MGRDETCNTPLHNTSTDEWLQRAAARKEAAAPLLQTATVDGFGQNLRQILTVFEESSITKESLTVSGRVSKIHKLGAVIFASMEQDGYEIELKLDRHYLTPNYDLLMRVLQTGDVVRVSGMPIRSKRGGPQILVSDMRILALCALPQRLSARRVEDSQQQQSNIHSDLLANPEELVKLKLRSVSLQALRSGLEAEGFHEQVSPVLRTSFFGGRSHPYTTYSRANKKDMYLRLTTEDTLKSMVTGGLSKVYELGPSFRNESQGQHHLTGFTILEACAAYTTLDEMLGIVSRLVIRVAASIRKAHPQYASILPIVETYDDITPFRKIPAESFIRAQLGVGFTSAQDQRQLASYCKKPPPSSSAEVAHLVHYFLRKNVFHEIMEPTFIVDLPAGLSPFIARSPHNVTLLQRAFLVIAGVKLSEVFFSQTDPLILAEELEQQMLGWTDNVARNNATVLDAALCGIPPVSVLAMGIERLFMVVTGEEDIRRIHGVA